MNKKHLIIAIHGYGSNGADLGFLRNEIAKTGLDFEFLNPDAPYMSQFPGGYEWYPIDVMEENYLMNGIRNVYPILEKYISKKSEVLKINPENVILIGFSQGGALALHTGLRHKCKIKAVISLSGGMANPKNILAKELFHKPKILLVHGDNDKILPHVISMIAHRNLKKNKINSEFKIIKGMNHTINEETIQEILDFIKKLI